MEADNTPTTVETEAETLLSDGFTLVELSTTEESEGDRDILIQGSDRKYPAIVVRLKHRGVGATVRTISKNGQHSGEYEDYAEVIRKYQERRDNRRKDTTTRGHGEDSPEMAREARVSKTIQSVVEGQDEDR